MVRTGGGGGGFWRQTRFTTTTTFFVPRRSSTTPRATLTFDSVCVLLVSVGCLAIVWDADREGRAPLHNQFRADQWTGTGSGSSGSSTSAPPVLVLTPDRCRTLQQDGVLVIDGFLSRQLVSEASESIARRDRKGRFAASQNERDAAAPSSVVTDPTRSESMVRTDRIRHLTASDDDAAMTAVRNRLHDFAKEVTTAANFQGFAVDEPNHGQSYGQSWLGIPAKMQVSIYDYDSNKDVGSYYRDHLDCCSDQFWDLGVLGYLRSAYLRRRYMTCIVYLNNDWQGSHEGCLRMTQRDGSRIDIAPVGGRLVVFSSAHRWHAVLPTSHTRYACSMWLTLND
jgi:2OG-Fe(II) oxygenase superfamily